MGSQKNQEDFAVSARMQDMRAEFLERLDSMTVDEIVEAIKECLWLKYCNRQEILRNTVIFGDTNYDASQNLAMASHCGWQIRALQDRLNKLQFG